MNILKKGKISFGCICLGIALCFIASMAVFILNPTRVHSSKPIAHSSQPTTQSPKLPAPSKLLKTSKIHSYPVLKGIKINPKDPFKLEFIIDTQDKEDISKEELSSLIKYFLAALTIPEEDLWVNLSPYEKNRIIPDSLSLTNLGKDLLGECRESSKKGQI